MHVKPSFLIIGAQKAGSTALFDYLGKHPQIVQSSLKEVDYFGCEGRFRKGVDFYHSHFPKPESRGRDLISFEASGHYLFCPEAPRRIYEYNPHIRLIAVLRDPVWRAFSAWNMYRSLFAHDPEWFIGWMMRCDEDFKAAAIQRRALELFGDFEAALREELAAYESQGIIEAPLLLHGRYSEQLARYYDVFGSHQILILESSELLETPVEALCTVTEFLGLEAHPWGREELPPVFKAIYETEMPRTAMQLLSEYYGPLNNQLYRLTGKDYHWS